mgnify:CR=1 FL=1
MSYKGRYKPLNPKKYKGDSSQVIYRSLWERKLMVYCDNTDAILEWGSEEVIIPYRSPWDGRIHRYFPDFYMKIKENDGKVKRYVIEVKPLRYCVPPTKGRKQKKTFIREVAEYAKNQAKWKAARSFCEMRQLNFKIVTEKELGVK